MTHNRFNTNKKSTKLSGITISKQDSHWIASLVNNPRMWERGETEGQAIEKLQATLLCWSQINREHEGFV